ncbi:hypothetical protein EV175_006646, partial [Coemansia sp. RSA 1933]
MDGASSGSGLQSDHHRNESVAHAQSTQAGGTEEECCHCCCKHQSCPKHAVASAEQLADEAAKDAGWNIRWPRIRMMADSPDLQGLSEASGKEQQQQRKSRDAPPSGRSAWTQIRRFVAEITEVFGREQSNIAAVD